MSRPRALVASSRGPTLSLLGAHGAVVGVELGLESPAHLAAHPSRPVGYVTLETDPGAVAAVDFTAQPRVLDLWQGLPANPCHVTVAPGGCWLYVCSYMGGAVTGLALTPEGTFDRRREPGVYFTTGSGPHPRQESSHPHSSLAVGDQLAVADLGTDEIRFYPLAGGELGDEPEVVRLPPGSGPRSLTAAGALVACSLELEPGVAWLERADGRWRLAVSSLELPPPAQPSETVLAGDRAVIAVRGTEVLGVVDRRDGVVGLVASPRGVRGLAPDAGRILAAAEKDDLVTEYLVSAAGLEPMASWAVTAPASVIAWPDGWAPGPAWRMEGGR
ncbi:MAG: lactonase family protein [Actinobacteria bacterium]|nr:lactonase family protein [Actinomycetota bacterium]